MTAARSVGCVQAHARARREPFLPTESEEQRAIIEWWSYESRRRGLPEFALYAVPNGGMRHAATAGRLKAEGVRKGVPDLVLAAARGPHHGAYLELKRLEGGSITPHQKAFGEYLKKAGYAHGVAWGFDEARAFLTAYLNGEALPA